MKEFKINGVIQTNDDSLENIDLADMFIDWIESKGMLFGGGIEEYTDEMIERDIRDARYSIRQKEIEYRLWKDICEATPLFTEEEEIEFDFVYYMLTNWCEIEIYDDEQKDEIVKHAHSIGLTHKKDGKSKHNFMSLMKLLIDYDVEIHKKRERIDCKLLWVYTIESVD